MEGSSAAPAAKRARRGAPGYFSRQDLAPFNLLAHPIWIFDIENKCMWWANDAAVSLWNADSLETLLERDYATDMSEATETSINGYLERFRVGETFSEQVSAVLCFSIEQICCFLLPLSRETWQRQCVLFAEKISGLSDVLLVSHFKRLLCDPL